MIPILYHYKTTVYPQAVWSSGDNLWTFKGRRRRRDLREVPWIVLYIQPVRDHSIQLGLHKNWPGSYETPWALDRTCRGTNGVSLQCVLFSGLQVAQIKIKVLVWHPSILRFLAANMTPKLSCTVYLVYGRNRPNRCSARPQVTPVCRRLLNLRHHFSKCSSQCHCHRPAFTLFSRRRVVDAECEPTQWSRLRPNARKCNEWSPNQVTRVK